MPNQQRISPRFVYVAACLFTLSPTSVRSLLLSDLPTPSFVIDVQALTRIGSAPPIPSKGLPSIRLPASGQSFRPHVYSKSSHNDEDCESIVEVIFPVEEGQPAIGYFHSSVVRAREDATPDDDPIATFLAELDLDPALCGRNEDDTPPAKLVLGLNNHHVGSYYWARSAGAGSSMEAPGVLFGCCKKSPKSRGILRWMDEGGPICCNSNDGKRSEWVNFLRKGDTVQLVPVNGQDAMIQMSDKFGANGRHRIFGISSEGRPMGSEPEVVCEWRQIS
jgi:hypothetical protein